MPTSTLVAIAAVAVAVAVAVEAEAGILTNIMKISKKSVEKRTQAHVLIRLPQVKPYVTS
ncbi:hypothetical protein GGS24DRAFT_508416 [Hypoxylon argillaceum]|nr:hypothetical protein GGS24DRAFT_508416 [Hypoxylon argillaceum]